MKMNDLVKITHLREVPLLYWLALVWRPCPPAMDAHIGILASARVMFDFHYGTSRKLLDLTAFIGPSAWCDSPSTTVDVPSPRRHGRKFFLYWLLAERFQDKRRFWAASPVPVPIRNPLVPI